MDEAYLELAEATTEHQRNAALAAAAAATQAQSHPDFDGTHCIDCEVHMPLQRLAMGRIRCVPCQTAVEHRERTHRRN